MKDFAVVTWSDRIHMFNPVENVITNFCEIHGYNKNNKVF
jgi:hypothetical protein